MTATQGNGMTEAERDGFLTRPLVTRLSTIREDGWAHTTPVWFLWEGGCFFHSIGPGRQHLRNLRRNSNITECIDIDERLAGDVAGRAAAVVCFGTAEVVQDEVEVRPAIERIIAKYLGVVGPSEYVERSVAEIAVGRRLVRVTPVRWTTWDYDKGD